jgi:hypothetical protein
MSLRPSDPEKDALFEFGHDGRTEPANDLEATLCRLQRAAGGPVSQAMPTDLRAHLWEDIMHATTVSPTIMPHITGGTAQSPSPAAPSRTPASPRIQRGWAQGLNALLAAALIVAMAGGLWRIAQNHGFGPGGNAPEPSSIPFGSFIQDDGSIDPAEFPTADDCIIEPRSVDDVMAILADPQPSMGWYPRDATLATPALTPVAQGYQPSQQTIDDAAGTWRMWVACDMADSLFQRWAVETPASIQSYVLARLPNLTGDDEAREILEELWVSGESDILLPPGKTEQANGSPVSNPVATTLVDPDPANSWEVSDGFLLVGIIWYGHDGTPMGERSAMESRQYAQMTNGPAGISCTVPMMGLAEDQTTWLVNDSNVGCG